MGPHSSAQSNNLSRQDTTGPTASLDSGKCHSCSLPTERESSPPQHGLRTIPPHKSSSTWSNRRTESFALCTKELRLSTVRQQSWCCHTSCFLIFRWNEKDS